MFLRQTCTPHLKLSSFIPIHPLGIFNSPFSSYPPFYLLFDLVSPSHLQFYPLLFSLFPPGCSTILFFDLSFSNLSPIQLFSTLEFSLGFILSSLLPLLHSSFYLLFRSSPSVLSLAASFPGSFLRASCKKFNIPKEPHLFSLTFFSSLLFFVSVDPIFSPTASFFPLIFPFSIQFNLRLPPSTVDVFWIPSPFLPAKLLMLLVSAPYLD
ncbi:hypothetical protein ASPWEDRAFT_203173 [Aspergillus wentii DTO 134E9]|uniref:Uncharacterized protein n=1 Tax=Aspergillus wentii DTO 134E9 TaxID=1073089 RepID=A0A1L9RZC5_ASPWE|nr:uncharacterized protein ASPWEDRAFT_203173 [Aspergillus wentii DTO 134E9]OJJ40320.1 hypothetical protein ASPWEDRAFT_203173 [Aspergillus wentii DTO 134E9]